MYGSPAAFICMIFLKCSCSLVIHYMDKMKWLKWLADPLCSGIVCFFIMTNSYGKSVRENENIFLLN